MKKIKENKISALLIVLIFIAGVLWTLLALGAFSTLAKKHEHLLSFLPFTIVGLGSLLLIDRTYRWLDRQSTSTLWTGILTAIVVLGCGLVSYFGFFPKTDEGKADQGQQVILPAAADTTSPAFHKAKEIAQRQQAGSDDEVVNPIADSIKLIKDASDSLKTANERERIALQQQKAANKMKDSLGNAFCVVKTDYLTYLQENQDLKKQKKEADDEAIRIKNSNNCGVKVTVKVNGKLIAQN